MRNGCDVDGRSRDVADRRMHPPAPARGDALHRLLHDGRADPFRCDPGPARRCTRPARTARRAAPREAQSIAAIEGVHVLRCAAVQVEVSWGRSPPLRHRRAKRVVRRRQRVAADEPCFPIAPMMNDRPLVDDAAGGHPLPRPLAAVVHGVGELDLPVLAKRRWLALSSLSSASEPLAYLSEDRPEQMHAPIEDDGNEMLAFDVGLDLLPRRPVAAALQPPVYQMCGSLNVRANT